MSPPVGNNSANCQQKPLAKYIGDLDSAATNIPRLYQRKNIDVHNSQFRLFNNADEIEILFPNKEDPVESLPTEDKRNVGDGENGFPVKENSSPKHVGNPSGEKTTCNNGCAKECVSPGPANAGLAISTSPDHPRGGGGGGGGGDDSDEDNKAQKKYDDHGKKVLKQKKRKQKKRSSDTDVEVPMAESPQDQPEQNPQNAENVMHVREKQKWHTRINRYNFCKCENKCCENCIQVDQEMRGYFEESNLDWTPVIEYHRKVCQFQYRCELCSRYKERELAIKNVCQLMKRRTESEDLIIWKNHDSFDDLSHFKELEHFYFEDDRYFAKGGFGEVHHIELPWSIKEKYFGSSCPRLVLKKAIVTADEMYVLRKTATHPNFVKTLLVVQKKENKFTHRIIMEKCDMSMKDFLKQLWKDGKALEKGEALFYWHQVVAALIFLHFDSIHAIHKDIKAANVLLTISDNMIRVKLADFGLVKCLPGEYTKSGLPAAGTRCFMAPEVYEQRAHGRPADIYSLGMLFLQLLFEHWKNVQ
ncbi:Serine threonine- kinase PLK4, partial [Paramuricea clavata]